MNSELDTDRLKRHLKALLSPEVSGGTAVSFRVVEGVVNGRSFRLTVFLAPRFLRAVRKGRLVNEPVLYSALANLKYGYDPRTAASPGGKDGIFNVSPDYRPRNEMVAKLYDRFFFTDRGQKELALCLKKPADAQGVRVVSHGMRLLGFIEASDDRKALNETLVLVDLDVNRR